MKTFVSHAYRLPPRLYHHPATLFLRTIPLSIFNYLCPIVQAIVKFGLQAIRAQVLPRIFAAAAALIDPSPARSQQREVYVIITPAIMAQRPFNNQETHNAIDIDAPESPRTRVFYRAPYIVPSPTIVTRSTVYVVPILVGISSQ